MKPCVGVIRDLGNLLWVQKLDLTPWIRRKKKKLLTLNKKTIGLLACRVYKLWGNLWELAGIDHVN